HDSVPCVAAPVHTIGTTEFPSWPVMLPEIFTPFGQSIVSTPLACVAVCDVTFNCRLPHSPRLPGSVICAPIAVLRTEVQVPRSDGADDADGAVRAALADGVVGMSTVV